MIFDSDLFHETGWIDFRDGYQTRRSNVILLYGRRSFHGGEARKIGRTTLADVPIRR